jgi:hypothetical protein
MRIKLPVSAGGGNAKSYPAVPHFVFCPEAGRDGVTAMMRAMGRAGRSAGGYD